MTGTTIAIITHNAAIGGMGDKVIHISSGRITERLAALVAEFNEYAQARNSIEVNTAINQP